MKKFKNYIEQGERHLGWKLSEYEHISIDIALYLDGYSVLTVDEHGEVQINKGFLEAKGLTLKIV